MPLTNLAALAAIALAGPGLYSLDALFHTSLPATWALLASVVALGVTWGGIAQSQRTVRQAAPISQREEVRVSERVTPAPETEQREASEIR